jgi:uncharacterized protein (TIGR03382 family)
MFGGDSMVNWSMDDLQAVTLGLTILAAVLLAAACWVVSRRR